MSRWFITMRASKTFAFNRIIIRVDWLVFLCAPATGVSQKGKFHDSIGNVQDT